MNLTRNFNKISKSDASTAGGKGASLGEMTQAGIVVPPGFVVLSSAFEKFLEETDLNVEIDSILHSVNLKEMRTIENASEKIKDLILKAEIPQGIKDEIKREFPNFIIRRIYLNRGQLKIELDGISQEIQDEIEILQNRFSRS
mgnify:CR=1 FL=1